MAEPRQKTTVGSSYLMGYYLGRQSQIEYAYQLAMMDAKTYEQKRQLLLEQKKDIEKTLKDYEMLSYKLQSEKAKTAAGDKGNASAIINGYIGIGNLQAKSQANKLRAAELGVEITEAPGRVKTYIMNSSSDRVGMMGTQVQAEGFISPSGTQFAEINQALTDLTPEQRYDAVLNLQDQINAEMIGDGAPASDRAAVKSLIFSTYLPGVSNPSRSDYNTKAAARQQQIQQQGGGGIGTSKLNAYIDQLIAGGTDDASIELANDALLEAALANDGELNLDRSNPNNLDNVFYDAAKTMPGFGKYLKDQGYINYDPSTFKFRKKGAQESQADYDAAKAVALTQYNDEFDQAINAYFMSRIGSPTAQLAKRIGEERVQLGIVEQQITQTPMIGASEFQTLFGEKLGETMSPEMMFDTKTREGRKNFKMYEMNKALEAQMMKMTPSDRYNYQLALQTAEDFETIGYDNAKAKYSQYDQTGVQYAQQVMNGLHNGTLDKTKVIPNLETYIAQSQMSPEQSTAFKASALSLIYLDQYRVTMEQKAIPKKFKIPSPFPQPTPETMPEEGYFKPKRDPIDIGSDTGF